MSSPSPTSFRFLDPPKELRLHIYEQLAESSLRPLIHRAYNLYFRDTKAPTALLLVNKTIHSEAAACLDEARKHQPVKVVRCLRSRRYAVAVNRMLATGLEYDKNYLNSSTNDENANVLGVWTKRASTSRLKSLVEMILAERTEIHESNGRYPHLLDCDLTPLHDFLYLSLMKSRRSSISISMQNRCLIGTRVSSYPLQDLQMVFHEAEIPQIGGIPCKVTIVTTRGSMSSTYLRWNWPIERPTSQELEIMETLDGQ